MLDNYIDECTVSVIIINTGIKEPTRGHRNCNTGQILKSGGGEKIFVYPSYYLGQYPF